jgi:hypothetical protein
MMVSGAVESPDEEEAMRREAGGWGKPSVVSRK